jgi:L-lactate dehydrogenase complex protein LldF
MVRKLSYSPTFEETAKTYLENTQLRRNISLAAHTIREKRKKVVDEMSDWEALREAGSKSKSS